MDGLRPRADGGFISRLMLFLAISVLCGLLVAGVTLPIVGGLGLAARDSAEGFDSLPAELEIPPLPERSRILASDGSLIATFYEENRISVPISEVAPVMRKAVIAIEDSRFYQHGGIDLRGTMRAFVNNQSGEDVQGGSTLTQQYVKQVLLEAATNIKDEKKRLEAQKAATAQSYTRKLRELRYAVALEEKYTKEQILERYLNIAYFGASAYGVEAAAKRYFNIHAIDLSLAQAALLAGIVQQPTAFDPTRNPDRALARRNIVLDRMAETGLATQQEVDEAKATELALKPSKRSLQNGCQDSKVAFFCDFVLKTIQNDKTFGAERIDRTRLLLRGGLTITTTLDPDAQKYAQESLADHVDPRDEVASALVSVQPGTGLVRAMAVSRDFGDKKKRGEIKFNPATDRAYGGSSGFQAGSTFKPFVAAAALEKGYPFSYPIYAPYQVEHRRRAGLQRDPDPGVGAVQRDHQRERHVHAGDRHRGLHQHLLRPARGAGRGVPAQADRRGPGPAARGRRRPPGGQVVHARGRRGLAAEDGRGLRVLRGPRRALQLDRDPRGDRPVRQPPPGAAGRLQAGHRPGHR